MKKGMISALLFAGFLSAQGTTTKASSQRKPVESLEHRFARMNLEKAKEQLALLDKVSGCLKVMNGLRSSGAEPTPLQAETLQACRVLNGVEFGEQERKLCNVFRGTPSCDRYELALDVAKTSLALLKQNIISEAALDDVDKCVRFYRSTIDKKQSDLTQREAGQIKSCQEEDLYPPKTK